MAALSVKRSICTAWLKSPRPLTNKHGVCYCRSMDTSNLGRSGNSDIPDRLGFYRQKISLERGYLYDLSADQFETSTSPPPGHTPGI